MRRLAWSDHALGQLKERKLSKQVVITAFRKPDRVVPQARSRYQLLKVVKRQKKQYLLLVVFDREVQTDTVVTVFITSKIKKYLL